MPDPSTYVIPPWELWSLGGLLIGSFFFAGTETALTSLGESRARQLQEKLGPKAKLLDRWIEHPEKVLSALLIGNNLMNIAASAIFTDIALKLWGDAALAIATGVMTLMVLVFGEITPKTIAREHAERWSIVGLRILGPFYRIVYPLSVALSQLASGVSRWFGAGRQRPLVSSEDVDWLIDLSAREGALDEVKQELLSSVVEFTELVVKEIMIPRTQVVAIEDDMDPEAVLELAAETGHSRFPVYHESIDEVIGILAIKDLLPALRQGKWGTEANDLKAMLRPAFFVPEVQKASTLMKDMQLRRTHMAIVVDEFGGTSGIVTLEDAVEEIVGEIRDEHDVEEPPIVRLSKDRMLVLATVSVRELEDELDDGLEFPDDGDYESLGGFMVAQAGNVPPVGESIQFNGWQFIVRAADERRVLRVELVRSPEPEEAPQERSVGT